jgi:hypothetical protein
MKRIQHLRTCLMDLAALAWAFKMYWIVPALLVLALLILLLFAGSGSAPFLYRVF